MKKVLAKIYIDDVFDGEHIITVDDNFTDTERTTYELGSKYTTKYVRINSDEDHNEGLSTTHNAEYVYIDNRELNKGLLSEFYYHIAKYFDIINMKDAKESLIKSFIEK